MEKELSRALRSRAAGFTEGQKRDACWYLEAVVRELHERRSVQKTLLIRQARIPIVKASPAQHQGSSCSVLCMLAIHGEGCNSRKLSE